MKTRTVPITIQFPRQFRVLFRVGFAVFLITSVPIIILHAATVKSVQNGDWNVNITWDSGSPPTLSDVVQISHTVTFNMFNAECSSITINNLGTLKFDAELDSRTMVVAGNVDIMNGGKLLMPPNTGYVSALKIKCDTDGQYGIIVNNGGIFDVQGTTTTTPFTRNCLLASDNPSAKTYIQNLSSVEANFNMYYVEVSSMGTGIAGKYGITFYGSGTRGKINYCSIHNGYNGIYLYNSSNNTLSNNNCYSNTNNGIYLNASCSNNTLNNNNCYSNSLHGIYLFGSSNNTLNNNSCYSNSSGGIYLNSTSNNNTLANNSCYANSYSGIYLYSDSNSNTMSNNSCYSNQYGIYTNGSANNSVVNCDLGKNGNNINGDIGYYSSFVSKLTLKDCNLYSTIKVDTTGINTVGSYLVSYNQDGASGTTKIWGDYNIPSGSTGTFNYGNLLYVSTATLPNSTKSGIGTITYPVTIDSMTVTELWEVKCYDDTFGYFTVKRGTYTPLALDGTATAGTPYTSTARGVGFTLLTTNFVVDDAFYFVTISSSADANVQKKLEFNDSPVGTRMFVDTGGTVQMLGTPSAPTISTNAVGSTYYGFQSSGTLNLSNYTFSNLKSNGLEIYPQANVVDLSSGTFNTIQGSADSSYIRVNGLTSNKIFYGCAFNDTPGTANYNIKADGAGINWTFLNWSGVKAGVAYTSATNGAVILWDPAAPAGISDLTALKGANNGQIVLQWTSPGDDGVTGNLTGQFEIEWTTGGIITNSNYYAPPPQMTSISISTSNLVPLTACTTTLYNLVPGATYYFAIKAKDDVNNISVWNSKDDVTTVNTAAYIYIPSVVKSVVGGNDWRDPNKWEGGSVPWPSQGVEIQSGHTVIFNSNDTSVTCSSITISGTLQFQTLVDSRTMVVAGNVDIMNGGKLLMPPNTGYVSVLKIRCDTDGQYGIIVNNGGIFDVQGNTTTTPSTRNCLIASDNPSAKTYIRNLSQTEANFNMYYVEVSSVGVDAVGKYGVTFDGAGTRGKINYCSIHNGWSGICLYNSSNNTISNNSCYSNLYEGIRLNYGSNNTLSNNNSYSNYYGIWLNNSSNNNTISNNTIYANSYDGIFLYGSSNNTLSNNSCYSNQYGIYLFQSSNNTLSNNNSYSNSNRGIYLNTSSNNNTLNNNSCYSNSQGGIYLDYSSNNTLSNNNSYSNSYGIYTYGSSNNTAVNCSLGSDGSNSSGDIGYVSSAVSKLILKGCNLYSTTKVNTTGINTAGSYLVSYNQDGAGGITKIWGDYHILSGSTGTFNYGNPLYVSTATLPNSTLKGTGSITYPTTTASTLTEFWEVKCYDDIFGYFTVKRGTYTPLALDGTATAQTPYSSTARGVGFTLLTTNFVVDDAFYFITISSSADQSVQKKIEFNDSPIGTRMFVDTGGTVQMLGTPTEPTISTNAVGSTYYGFFTSGTIDASNYVFSNLASSGVVIVPGANVVDLSTGAFDNIQSAVSPSSSTYINVKGLNSTKTFYGCVFNAPADYNVRADGAGIDWTFTNATGARAGESFDDELNGAIISWGPPSVIEPITNLSALVGDYVGAVKLTWTYPQTLSAGSSYYIQYSTDPAFAWTPTTAQVIKSTIVAAGVNQQHNVGGLDVGIGGSAASPDYYFRIWITTGSGAFSAFSNSASNYANTPAAGTDIGPTTQSDGGWLTTFNDASNGSDFGQAVAKDNSGNVYITGYFSNGSNDDILVRKYNATGSPLWTKYYNSPNNNVDTGYGIAVDGSGNVYVTGFSSQGVTGADIWVRKYNTNGLILWTTTYNSPDNRYDAGYGIAVDNSGNVYVTGFEYRTTGVGWNNIWVRKYSTDGLVQWTTTYNSSDNNNDIGYGIAVDDSGNVYVTGYEYRTVGDANIWVRKYNTNGLVQWTTTYNSPDSGWDEGRGIAVDNSGNVYVTGSEYRTGENDNIWVRKYDTNGNVLWTKTYNNLANASDKGNSIAVDNSGNVYVAGRDNAAGQSYNIWVRKYNTNGLVQWTTTYNGPANANDEGRGIAVDDSGNIYVTGYEGVSGQGDNIWLRKYVQNKPNAPSSIIPINRATTSITWGWTDNSSGFQYQEECTRVILSSAGVVIATVTTDVSTYQLINLSPNTSSQIRLEAYNIIGSSLSANSSPAFTSANPPINLTFTNIGSSSVAFQWDVNSNPNYTKFGVARSTNSEFTGTEVSTFVAFGNNLTANTTTAFGLNADTTYYIRVWAYNEDQIQTASIQLSIKTLFVDTTPPAGISDLTALKGANNGQIVLQWTSPGDDGVTGNLTGQFEIEWTTGGIITNSNYYAPPPQMTSISISTSNLIPLTACTTTLYNLVPGATYYFAIKAKDDVNNISVWNSKDDVTTVNTAAYIYIPAVVKSMFTGNWNDSGTWEGNTIPWSNQGVQIQSGHIITLNNDLVSCSTLTIYGTLQFDGAVSSRTLIVAGNIDIQSPSGQFLMPPNTGYISALKIKCNSAGEFGIIVNNGGIFNVQGSSFTGLTRNCLIASDNPSAKTYIRNLSQTEANFNMYYVEVSSVGVNATSKLGITFDGSLTRGKINYCSIHNGYYGIYLNYSSNNTITNNSCYSNTFYGINLWNSSKNALTNNSCYSNGSGIYLQESSSNTITNNSCYSNNQGIYLWGSSNNNILSNNRCYSNSYGINLQSSSNNTLNNNNCYSNSIWGIYTNDSINNTVVNCELGKSGNNTSGDIGYNAASASKLTLKNCNLYSATKVNTTGINTAGSYLVSYNQDGAGGTTKIWGDYHVGQAGGLQLQKLNYAEPLYVSTATLPNSTLKGTGSITYPTTNNNLTLTEFWEIRCINATATSVFSVKRGTSTVLSDATPNQAIELSAYTSPTDRGVGFTVQTGAYQLDDAFYFVTISSSNDKDVQKKLEFNDSPIGTKLTVDTGGSVQMLGTPTEPTISTNAVGSTYYGFQSSGSLNLSNYVLSNLKSNGLEIYPQANVVDLSSGTFNTIQDSADSSYIRVSGLTSAATFYGCAFNDTPGYADYNVKADGSGINWTYANATGVKAGENYDYDGAGSTITWTETIPPGKVTGLAAATGTQVKLSWTAPGDDGYTGNVTGGMWRITYTSDTTKTADTAEYTFEKSSNYIQGTTYSEIITGLKPRTTYWFWIRAADESANYSVWSDSAPAISGSFCDIQANISNVDQCSLAWGDYDNDGDLDLVIGGYTDSGAITKIYRNDNENFVDIGTTLSGIGGLGEGSLSWGDYDNDGDLDLALAGCPTLSGSAAVSKIYRNDSGNFVDISAGLVGVYYSSLAWGDYDNDGDLDLVMAGYNVTLGKIFKIYRNDFGTFVDINASLPGVASGCLAWGDYDNDGDLDLALTGSISSGRISKIYRNDSNSFVDIGAGLTGVESSSLAWGDYDNDGDLDLILTGWDGFQVLSKIYRNDSNNFIVGAEFSGSHLCSVAWGDYDNDGDLDGIISATSKIYRNDSSNFIQIESGLPSVLYSDLAWGDYDNDGDLDLIWAGSAGGRISKIYKSLEADYGNMNTVPPTPTNLTANCANDRLEFRWDKVTGDDKTASNGIYYNIRAATKTITNSLDKWIISPSTGAGMTPFLGNYSHGFVSALQPGLNLEPIAKNVTYYFQVQAIDTSFAKSSWSSVVSTYYVVIPPTVTDNQTGDNVVRSAAGTTYNVDFYDAGNLDTIQYKVWTLPAQTGSIVKDWTNIATNVNVPSYTTDWQVDFNSLYNLSATNYISVRAWDVAGNTNTVNDVFYVMKDTAPPTSSISGPSDASNVQTLTFITGVVSDNYGIDKVELQIKRLSDNYYWNGSNWQVGLLWVQASNNVWQYTGLTDAALTVGTSYWVVSRASDTVGNIEAPGAGNTFTYKTKKTISGGNWTNAATWFGGQTPLDGDAVVIKTGHIVDILSSNTSNLYSLTIEDGAKFSNSVAYMVNITSYNGGGFYNYGTSSILGTCYFGGDKVIKSTDSAQQLGGSAFFNAGSTVTLQSDITFGYVGLNSGGKLDAGNRQIKVNGGWQQDGIFVTGNSTVTFTGTNNQDIGGTGPGVVFANFVVNSSTTTTANKPLDINGNFTISGGTFVAGAYNHTISGDFKQTGGGFSAQTSTITFDGSGAQTVSHNPGSAFKHFNYSGTGSLTPLSNLDITGNFTEGAGTFNCGNYGYKIGGNMMNNTGWTLGGNSTFAFDGTLPQTIFNAINFDNVIVKNPTKVVYASDTLAQIKNLSIDPGCSFDSSALGYLEILGNFTSSGTFVHGGSFTRFGLSGNNTIWTVATSTFNNVIINKSVATDRVDALTNLSIGGTLEIYSGTLNMLKSSSTVEGATTIDGSYAKLDIGSSTTTLKGNVQVLNGGTLQLPNVTPASVIKLGGALTVDSGGFFVSLSSFNKVTSLNPGVQFYSFDILAGTINVTGLTFEWVNVNGMKIGASAKIPALNNINFQSLQSGATALNLLYSVIPGTFTFTGHNFEYSPANTKNVAAPNLTSGLVVMQNAIGSKSGPSYETDPNDRVFWQPGDSISVVKPSGGETYVVSTSTPILWNTAGNIKNVKLEYSKDDFVSNINFIANVSTSSTFGSYNWTIPNDLSATVKVRVSALNYSAICGTSTANFAIQQPVAAPSGLTTALLGTTSIQWLFIDNASDETDLYISSGVDVTMRLSENLASLAGAGGTTSWWEINLASNTQYTRYSEARNAVGSSWSVAVASYTMSSAPFWTQIVSRSSYSVELDWHPNGNPEPGTDYLVSHSTFMDFSSEINGTASTSTYIVSTLDSGKTYYFKVRSRNGDGVINQQYDAILTTTTLDGVVPAVAITEPANGSYKNYASIFSAFYGPASDNVAVSSVVISMRISGGNYTSGPAFDSVSPLWFDCEVYPSSWAYQPTPSDILTSGTMYVMEVKAVDASGNWSSVATSSCTYDNTQPASVVVSPANNSIINSLTTLSGTASDNTGLQWVVLGIQRLSDGAYWTGAAWGSPTWLAATGTNLWSYAGFTTANLTSGTSYWVISRATDFAVNIETSTIGSVVFTYQAPVNGVFNGDFSQVGGAFYNSTGDDGAQGVAVDTITVGGPYIFVVGTSSSGVTGYDYFTVKYNSLGVMLASATFNAGSDDDGTGIAVDNSGNVYVTGESNNGSTVDYVTIKYNSALVFQSSAVLNSGNVDGGVGIAADNNGFVYVMCEWFNGTNYDYLTVKYNNNLAIQSSAVFDSGSADFGSGIATDNSGNVHITGGSFNGTNYDYVTIKYNNNLVFQSSAVFNSGGNDESRGIGVDNSGNVYVNGVSLNGSTTNYVTIKYNNSLVFQSSAVFSGFVEVGGGVAVDNSGNVHITGSSNNGSNYDYVTIKYNSSLVFQSSAVFNSGYDDGSYGIATDNSGYAYVTGKSYNGTNYDFRTLRLTLPDLPAVAVPAAPTLTATEVTNSSIKWVWTDVANEFGYYLQTSTGGLVASLSADIVNYLETGFTPNTQYSRYVEAYNAGGIIASTVVSKYTIAALPTSFVCSSKDFNWISLSWSANSNSPATIYELYRSTDNTSFGLINQATTTAHTDTGLAQLTTYYYRLYSVNAEGLKTGPATVTVQTLNSVIKGPVSGKVTQSDGTAILGVLVQLYNNEGTIKLAEIFTKSDGTYLFENLDDGIYRVVCSWLVNEIESVVYKTDIPENSKDVIFTLEIKYDVAFLSGKITLGSRANFVSGKFAPAQQPFVELLQRGRVIAKIDADTAGNYTIPNLLPGKYVVRAFNGVQMSEPAEIKVKEGEKIMLNFRWALGLVHENVYAYPNPCKDSVIIRYKANTNHTVTLRIYNIAGELVRTIKGDGSEFGVSSVKKIPWNLENDDGSEVASGIYIYILELKETADDGEKATVRKKLAIIK